MNRFALGCLPLFISFVVSANPGAPVDDGKATERALDVPPTLESLQNPSSEESTGVPDLRRQMLLEAGKTVGFRGGMAAKAHLLHGALGRRSDELDKMFQFSPLITTSGTIPPVIVEARDVAAFSPDQIRTADRVYKITRAERFVSVPPTWRDYLYVGLPASGKVELPDFAARPQTSEEEAIWQAAVAEGWEDGQKQAVQILEANFNRLTRDYRGMLLYSTLLQNDMIGKTQVAESQQTVTGDGQQLMLGDKLKRVTKRAEFVPDPKRWRPTVTKEPVRKPNDPPKVATP
ncbi:type IV secretory system conjugative DNA transfer family protein [Stutzerimonas nitrititolerans]|uniref:type IV secretory system conjugative DNA transfer family protein n=1 Tax=Stutzerimonas nitrititolerans TaxID=2482751 RepID=UPI0028B01B44|nr:type IV secretory system conjugative DNA transfer family protein [Stutzerimonas nitrititolerans]